MNRPLALLGAFALALPLSPLAFAGDKKDAKEPGFQLIADEQSLIDLTNAERKKADKGLAPLKVNPKLMEAARKHAENMAAQGKFDHVLDEKTPFDRTKAAGYASGFIGENIAWNTRTPKESLGAWMNSEGHRNNILSADYAEIGVAVAKGKNGEPYWVQVFGKP